MPINPAIQVQAAFQPLSGNVVKTALGQAAQAYVFATDFPRWKRLTEEMQIRISVVAAQNCMVTFDGTVASATNGIFLRGGRDTILTVPQGAAGLSIFCLTSSTDVHLCLGCGSVG